MWFDANALGTGYVLGAVFPPRFSCTVDDVKIRTFNPPPFRSIPPHAIDFRIESVNFSDVPTSMWAQVKIAQKIACDYAYRFTNALTYASNRRTRLMTVTLL